MSERSSGASGGTRSGSSSRVTPPIPPSSGRPPWKSSIDSRDVLVADQDRSGAVQVVGPLRPLLPVLRDHLDLTLESSENQLDLSNVLWFGRLIFHFLTSPLDSRNARYYSRMPTAGGNAEAAENLLPLALSRPHDAIASARTLLAGAPAAVEASIAHQAWGIALRQLGDVTTAVRELRTALRLAEQSGRSERQADVLATLGATLGRAGRSREGLARLDRAVDLSRGALTGRVLLRRADVLLVLGRHREALDDLRSAITRLRRSGDQVWEARSRNYRGFIQLAVGSTVRADADFAVAEKLYAATGQEFEYAEARQNRGLVAYSRGDLPAALRYLDEAGRRFAAVGVVWPDLAIDRCGVLLAAGLSAEALAEMDQAIAAERRYGDQTRGAVVRGRDCCVGGGGSGGGAGAGGSGAAVVLGAAAGVVVGAFVDGAAGGAVPVGRTRRAATSTRERGGWSAGCVGCVRGVGCAFAGGAVGVGYRAGSGGGSSAGVGWSAQ